jgi:alkanesulfonate monooxygenase SsuD/methylene tetrahydromethanopterin reductase-like flavin-dependent oxidoreductase (luciferase family)
VDRICEEQDRDPASLEKTIGVFVEPTEVRIVEQAVLGVPLSGSPAEIAERIGRFAEMGVTMLELVPFPDTDESADALAEIVQILDA